jgi:hypothetical protein
VSVRLNPGRVQAKRSLLIGNLDEIPRSLERSWEEHEEKSGDNPCCHRSLERSFMLLDGIGIGWGHLAPHLR